MIKAFTVSACLMLSGCSVIRATYTPEGPASVTAYSFFRSADATYERKDGNVAIHYGAATEQAKINSLLESIMQLAMKAAVLAPK